MVQVKIGITFTEASNVVTLIKRHLSKSLIMIIFQIFAERECSIVKQTTVWNCLNIARHSIEKLKSFLLSWKVLTCDVKYSCLRLSIGAIDLCVRVSKDKSCCVVTVCIEYLGSNQVVTHSDSTIWHRRFQ